MIHADCVGIVGWVRIVSWLSIRGCCEKMIVVLVDYSRYLRISFRWLQYIITGKIEIWEFSDAQTCVTWHTIVCVWGKFFLCSSRPQGCKIGAGYTLVWYRTHDHVSYPNWHARVQFMQGHVIGVRIHLCTFGKFENKDMRG